MKNDQGHIPGSKVIAKDLMLRFWSLRRQNTQFPSHPAWRVIYVLGTQHNEDNSFRPLEPVRVVNRTKQERASLSRRCPARYTMPRSGPSRRRRRRRGSVDPQGPSSLIWTAWVAQKRRHLPAGIRRHSSGLPPGPRCLSPPGVTTVWDRPREGSTRLRAVWGAEDPRWPQPLPVPSSTRHETQRTRPTHDCRNELLGPSWGVEHFLLLNQEWQSIFHQNPDAKGP